MPECDGYIDFFNLEVIQPKYLSFLSLLSNHEVFSIFIEMDHLFVVLYFLHGQKTMTLRWDEPEIFLGLGQKQDPLAEEGQGCYLLGAWKLQGQDCADKA